jgi:hypothetical protein
MVDLAEVGQVGAEAVAEAGSRHHRSMMKKPTNSIGTAPIYLISG